MNRVEFFNADTDFSLQEKINIWCKHNGKEPISISLAYMSYTHRYVAAVVVKELYSD